MISIGITILTIKKRINRIKRIKIRIKIMIIIKMIPSPLHIK